MLDPFAGTGTTAWVAQQLGRRWIAVEKERDYVDLMIQRLGVEPEPARPGLLWRRPAA